MKLRHAAALALVGWYLMLPLLDERGHIRIDPLSDWDQYDAFDSARECREAGLKYVRQLQRTHPTNKSKIDQAAAFYCVASDDPRLAK